MKINSLLLSSCLAFFAIFSTRSEEPAKEAKGTESKVPLPGHSMHGEAFNEGPRQKAYLMEGMPKIDFAITTQDVEAQKFFHQGIGQLHGFWYFEAERSFRQVAALDPDCAMAYWGMAMANQNNEKRAKEFMAKATKLAEKISKREKLWIEALAEYHKEGKSDKKQRRRDYVRKLEEIVQEYPDDIEAKAFLVFQIWDNNRDVPINSHLAVDALIADVLEANPMHPIHHYRIHLWDYEKAKWGLDSAAKCGQSSPGVAHMWHMPGHIFSKLHRYGDAAWQQEASARVDHAHMLRDRVMPDQIHNYAHNNEWLIRDLMHVGRVQDALDLAKNMIELPRHPKYNTLEQRGRSASYGRARLMDVLLQFELWPEVIELSKTMYLEPTDLRAEKANRFRVLGVAYFHQNEPELGRIQIAKLETLLQEERRDRYASADKAEAKAREEKQSEDKTAKAMADALQSHSGKIRAIENALRELEGYRALSEQNRETALKSFEQAHGIAKDRMSRIYLELGDREKAEKLAAEAVKSATNQVHALANYVYVLSRCDKIKEAKEQFETLRTLAEAADRDTPALTRLEAFAREEGYPDDWRLAPAPRDDLGDRPELSSLGPFRWQPPRAPEWTLPDPDGSPVSLANYSGKPVLAIFYLGARCFHCVEQLKAFAPMAADFQAAGISLVAISTDSVEGLRDAFPKEQSENRVPFPLLSDASMQVFKAYRAYDDFENMPLHGTFLIDAGGLVRWQDISYEPFTDAKFLLNESKRLLGLAEAHLVERKKGRDRELTRQGL